MKNWFPGLIMVLVLVCSGCKEKELVPKPESLLPEETYVNIMAELQLLDAWVFTSDEISNPDSIKQKLFEYYRTSEQEFRLSNSYYQSNTESHQSRIDSALKILEKEQEKLYQLSKSGPDSERR